VIKLAEQFVPLKLNAEKEGKKLAGKYGVKGYPAILFVDANGEVFGRIGGYMPAEPFAAAMTKIQTAHKDLPAVQEALKKDPGNGEANAELALIMALRGKLDEADAALTKAEAAKYTSDVLANAYNEIGDIHQSQERLDEAIGYFKKADAATKDPAIRSYAKVSLMVCYGSKRDTASARACAEELVALEGATPEYVEHAKKLLER